MRSANISSDSPAWTRAKPDATGRGAAGMLRVPVGRAWLATSEYAGARTIGAPAATLGVSVAAAASPAAIQRARPENIARRGSPTARCPFACSSATTTDDTSPAHSSQATISRARTAMGTISVVVSWRSKKVRISSAEPIPGTGDAEPMPAREQTISSAGMPMTTSPSTASAPAKRPQAPSDRRT